MTPSSTVRPWGWFPELGFEVDDQPSLRDVVSAEPQRRQPDIERYLVRGWILFTEMGEDLCDVLSRDREAIGPLSGLTDGEWVWPSVLGYYVHRYNVRLPADFVAHMEAVGWEPQRPSGPQKQRALQAVTLAMSPVNFGLGKVE